MTVFAEGRAKVTATAMAKVAQGGYGIAIRGWAVTDGQVSAKNS